MFLLDHINSRHRIPYALAALVGLLSISFAWLPTQAQSAPCVQEVVVQPGESVAVIAARIFGTQDAVAGIIAATNAQAAVDDSYTTIGDPNSVEAGWKLCIPGDPANEQVNEEDVDAATAEEPAEESAAATPANRGPSTTPRSSTVKSTAMAARNGSSRAYLGRSNIALEENSLLLEATLAARLGDDGLHPLSIEYLRQQPVPGSPLTIEETLPAGGNYNQYLVSYPSESLTLYALMTVPEGEKPATGWPVVIFNHGYIEPELYRPTERYLEYIDAIAGNGYIVLRPDLRGHATSEGAANGAYGDPGYTIDVLNALASIRQYPDADPNRIGMWGHSMGGYITARVMVASPDVKAGVIWAGVVAAYPDLLAEWTPAKGTAIAPISVGEMPINTVLVEQYGEPSENPGFWDALSANAYVADLSGPVQLHHGTADAEVPAYFSENYFSDVIAAGKVAEYYVYEGDDHNISAGFETAMRRSLEFLDAHVKNAAPAQATSPALLVP